MSRVREAVKPLVRILPDVVPDKGCRLLTS